MYNTTIGDFIISRAGYDDVDEIASLMRTVYAGIDDKETFICDDKDFVLRHIETNGLILIAKKRTLLKICAVFIIRYPQNSDDNLGKYIGLSNDELLKVAHMESAVVGKDARGNHLEAQMMRICESYIDDKYEIFMGMASPINAASIKAFISNGYTLAKENIDYNGFRRNLYIKYRDK